MRLSQGRCKGVRSRRDQMSLLVTRPRRWRDCKVLRSQFRSGSRRKPSSLVYVSVSAKGEAEAGARSALCAL